MDSDSDGTDNEIFEDAENNHSDSSNEDPTPAVWKPPSMSETMRRKMEQFKQLSTEESPSTINQTIDADFVNSLSRVSARDVKNPPAVPKKPSKLSPQINQPDVEMHDSLSEVEMRENTKDDQSQKRISVKERAKCFERIDQSQMAEKDKNLETTTQKVQQQKSPEKEDRVNTSANSDFESQSVNGSDIDPQFGDNSGIIGSENQVEKEEPIIEDIVDSKDAVHTKPCEENQEQSKASTGMQQEHQGHSSEERSSPWPHTPRSHYPGPRSSHGWPGTAPVMEAKDFCTPRQPPHQHPPPYNSGMPTPTPITSRPPSQMEYLPPEHANFQQYGVHGHPGGGVYPQSQPKGFLSYPTHNDNRMPFYPTGQNISPYPTGQNISPYPTYQQMPRYRFDYRMPAQYQPSYQQSPAHPVQKESKSPPGKQGKPSPETKSKTPGKQVPTGKGGNTETQKPTSRPSSTSKASGIKPQDGKNKAVGGKDTPKDKGSEADNVKTRPPKQESEKHYLCVNRIDIDQSNETVFNYLEARSKGELIHHESLRTEDDKDHAIVVFEDQIDLKALKNACDSRKLGNSCLEFDDIEPPRSVIASSEDEKFTKDMFKDYLTNKKKQDIVRVSTTTDGAVSAKFKNALGVSEILKDQNVKISGCKVTISVMYNCEHGTYWDKCLHTVAIPVPYKPTVNDAHIKKFLIDIQSVCNEQLEKHHARLIMEDELHIECTIQPKDRDARQKVKVWKKSVQTAWEEFVKANAKKRELQINNEIKELMIEHVNNTKQAHKTETLKVISPDETGLMKFIFVGQLTVVENYHEQITAKKSELEENQKRKNRIKNTSLDIKPLEVALMKKENEMEKLSEIAEDFSFEADEESGKIRFTGVEEDIQNARAKVYEIKNKYNILRLDTLTNSQCRLLESLAVSDLVYEAFSERDIRLVFKVDGGCVTVCSTHDNQMQVENVFKGIVMEGSIVLDASGEAILTSDEWFNKKSELEKEFEGVAIIDAFAGDKIVVTSTKENSGKIIQDLRDFIKENSVYEDEIRVQDNPIFKFLKLHHEDWFKSLIIDNTDQNLEIQYDRNPIKVKGTKKAIKTAMSEIKREIHQIESDRHSVSKPGVDLLFNDSTKADSIINPVEEDSKTVITIDQSPGKQEAFNRRSGPRQSDDDYVNKTAFQNFSRDTKPRKGGGGKALKSGPVVCANNTTITLVKKADIANQKADVIVCSTNGQLDMSGPAGGSLVRGAGTQLLDDIKSNYTDGIQHGDIAVIQGYNLKCQEVYLAALPSWSPGGEKMITQCVDRCLQQASKFKSIVFPAFGTGNFHYPRDLVAREMYKCVSQFDGHNTSLKDIRFLVYDDDTVKTFEREEIIQLNPGYQPQTLGISAGDISYRKNNITVKLKQGDLGHQKLEVLVSAVPQDLNLEKAGGAGISLMKGLGHGVQQDIANQHPSGVSSGGFASIKLSSPTGPCKFVYLTSLDSWNSEKKIVKEDDKQICKFVYQCLETAEKNGCKSIGIPAMGTGKIGYPADLVANYMYKMVEKFANNYKKSILRDVRFVLYHKDTKTVKAFEDEQKKWAPPIQNKAVPSKFSAGDGSGNSDKIVPKPLNDQEYQVGDVKLTVEQGDILSKNCDAIVNGCSDDFDLSKGAVSQAIRKKCDSKKLDDECTKKKADMIKFGVACTSSCGLSNCKNIIHIATKNSHIGWKKVIKEALKKAEKKQFTSLAFPALGTGAAAGSEEHMGATIMEALVEFVSERKPSNLKQVYLVIFQDKMVKNMMKGVRSGGHSAMSKGTGLQKVVKSHDKNKSLVSFTIYYLSENHLKRAKKLLDQAVEDKYKTEKVHDSVLREAQENEIKLLMSIGDNYPIKITVDTTQCDVILDGILDEVMNAKQDVFDALRKFGHVRHCKAEAAIIKEQVQWYLKDTGPSGLPELIEYPDLVNMYLETAYKGESGRTEVEFNDDQGEEYVIVLKDMTEYLKKDRSNKVDVIRREKIQGGAGSTEAPPEWDEQGTESIKVVTLLNTSPEFKSVEKKFIDSVFSGRKEWASQFNKLTLTVTKIERIQNLNLWRMYAAKRDLIEKQNPSGTQNERELWHGTPESAVVSINFYGFNRSYCRGNSKDAYWGDGVYFSADASYSARSWLAAGTGGGHAGEHNIYMCKVITGVTMKGQRNMRYLPIRQDGTMLNYDSATDANYNPTVEYVIFNDTQAYPQYRIKFKY